MSDGRERTMTSVTKGGEMPGERERDEVREVADVLERREKASSNGRDYGVWMGHVYAIKVIGWLRDHADMLDHTAPEPTPEADCTCEPGKVQVLDCPVHSTTPDSDLPYAGNHGPEDCYGECPQHRRERDATPEEREGGERPAFVCRCGARFERHEFTAFENHVCPWRLYENEHGEPAPEGWRPTPEGEPVGDATLLESIADDMEAEYVVAAAGTCTRCGGTTSSITFTLCRRCKPEVIRECARRLRPRTDRPDLTTAEGILPNEKTMVVDTRWYLEMVGELHRLRDEADRPERGLVEDWSRLYRLRELMDRHQKEGEPMPIAEPYIGIITAALRHLRDDGSGGGDERRGNHRED